MPSAFLSYSSNERATASLIAETLTTRGLTTWIDHDQIRAGQRWPKVLGEAIAKSDVLLLLWSAASSQSDWVELEWNTSLALRKQIIPLRLDETPLPPTLAALQTLPAHPIPADEILTALTPTPKDTAAQQRVINQLAVTADSTPRADVVKILQTPKSLLDKWQAWVGLVASILTIVSIAYAFWQNTAHPPPISEQPFAGSIWTPNNEPLPGVQVSLQLNDKLLATYVTDHLGHFAFHIAAPPDADITLIAQKPSFQTEKRYATLGNTNFNFTMSGAAPK